MTRSCADTGPDPEKDQYHLAQAGDAADDDALLKNTENANGGSQQHHSAIKATGQDSGPGDITIRYLDWGHQRRLRGHFPIRHQLLSHARCRALRSPSNPCGRQMRMPISKAKEMRSRS